MAAPHATGLAAIGFANYRKTPCNPELYGTSQKITPNARATTVLKAMRDTANKLGKFTGRSVIYGYGLPDAEKMVKLLLDIRD